MFWKNTTDTVSTYCVAVMLDVNEDSSTSMADNSISNQNHRCNHKKVLCRHTCYKFLNENNFYCTCVCQHNYNSWSCLTKKLKGGQIVGWFGICRALKPNAGDTTLAPFLCFQPSCNLSHTFHKGNKILGSILWSVYYMVLKLAFSNSKWLFSMFRLPTKNNPI